MAAHRSLRINSFVAIRTPAVEINTNPSGEEKNTPRVVLTMEPREVHGNRPGVFTRFTEPGLIPVAVYAKPSVATTSIWLATPMPTIGYSVTSVYCAGHACMRYGSQNHTSFSRKPTTMPLASDTKPCKSLGGAVQLVLANSALSEITASVLTAALSA